MRFCLSGFMALLVLPALSGVALGSEIAAPARSMDARDTDRSSWESYQDQECADLKPGQSRTVHQHRGESPTRVTRQYKITRNQHDPRQLDLDLNILFSATDDGLTGFHDKPKIAAPRRALDKMRTDLQDNFVKRAQLCFQEFPLQDRQGNKLNVRILNDPARHDVPLNIVKIVGQVRRSHSEGWASHIDCPTIIHECLHLTGLVDGYSESDQMPPLRNAEGQALYNCRHPEPRDSVMSNQSVALEPIGKMTICYDLDFTKGGVKSTRIEIGESVDDSCPRGYGDKSSEEAPLSQIKEWMNNLRGTKGKVVKVKLPPQKTRKAVLRDGQMKALISPHCIRDNVYMACAKNAYITSSKTQKCFDTPIECRNGEWSK